MSEIFGVGGYFRRLLPTRVVFPASVHDDVVGFIVPSKQTAQKVLAGGQQSSSLSPSSSQSQDAYDDDDDDDDGTLEGAMEAGEHVRPVTYTTLN